jgi:cell wall-associated NlpC family hydrolase
MRRGLGLALAAIFAAAGCSPRPAFRAPIRPSDPTPIGPVAGPVPADPAPDPILTPADSALAHDETIRRLAAMADAWVGTPYRRGGLDSRGIDCSGLTRTVLAEFGVGLPRTTAAQRQIGRPVSREEMAPGDLLFFRLGSGRVNHVGVAIGEDRFLHASSTRGVVVDRLNDTYFGRRLVEARRVAGS